jgi:chromosomal replication initiator protein
VIDVVAEYYGLPRDDVISTAVRERLVVEARRVAMYLCRQMTKRSYPVVARYFKGSGIFEGPADHTSVMVAVKCVREAVRADSTLAKRLGEIEQMIREAS